MFTLFFAADQILVAEDHFDINYVTWKLYEAYNKSYMIVGE